ncbi:uncharacterized protein LOC130988697 isoform X2 [Salvia miltiorrhiza]|uniref:uncharacterized protein LOC130988697 isoform X2 n=1 Tax=Salvia miltiorrhiza TaxID=226208 RepID=UPI0025AB6143|nr:uncharacterized protein LOC130988697 isoform X2 [Salvia miltiorrhiza]
MDTLSTEILCGEKANGRKNKTRKSKKARVKDEGRSLDQNNIDTQLIKHSTEGNVFVDKLIKDEVQSAGQTKIVTRSMKKLAERNATIEKPKDKDEHEFFCQRRADTGSSANLSEVSVATENPVLLDEYQSNIDTGPTKSIAEGTVTGKRTEKRKRTARGEIDSAQCKPNCRNLAEENLTTKKSKIKDEVQKTGPTEMDIGNLKLQDETQSMCHTDLDNAQAQSVVTKRKTKKKANVTNEKPIVKDELRTLGQIQMHTGSTENLADGKVTTKNPKTLDEAQSMNKWQPAENLAQGDVAQKRIKKRKNKKKAIVIDEFHSEMDTRPENLAERVATLNKPEIKDAERSVGLAQMDVGSTENVSEGNVIIENPKDQDEFESIDQLEMDIATTQSLDEGNVTVKRKKKGKKPKKAAVDVEFSSRMDAGPTEKLAKVNVNTKVLETRDEVPNMGLTQMDTGSADNVAEGNATIENPKDQDEFRIIDQAKVDTGPTQPLADGNVTVKRKKRRKKTKKAKVQGEFYGRKDAGATANLAEVNVNVRIPETRDEVHNMGLTQIDTGSTDNVAEGNVTIENPKDQDEFQIVDQAKVDTGPTQNLSDGNVTVKRKKRRKKTKKVPETRDEVPNVCSTQMDTGSTDNVAEGNVTIENPKDQDEFQIIDQAKVDSGPTQNLAEGNVTVKRKKRRKKNKKAKGHAEGRSAIPCLKMAPIVSFSKKLIVLDINGLLADVVFPAPKHYTGDIKVFGRAGDPSVMIF